MQHSTHLSQKSGLKSWLHLVLAASSLAATALACSSANFGSNSAAPTSKNASGTPDSSAPGAQAPGTTPAASSSTGTPGACTTDQVKLDWSGEEKACFDKGQIWAFDTKKCMDIRKASFECNWANAIAELDKKGLTTQTIKDDFAAGAKLISCGQAQDGKRIVIQWIKVADGAAQVACNGGSSTLQHRVTTGCYTYYTTEAVPAPATTQAEKDARVYACLSAI